MATIEPVKIELLDDNQALPEREAILGAFAEHYKKAIARAREVKVVETPLAAPVFTAEEAHLPEFHELAAAAEESGVLELEASAPAASANEGVETPPEAAPLDDIFAGMSSFDLSDDPFAMSESSPGTEQDMSAASLFDANAFGAQPVEAEATQMFAAWGDDDEDAAPTPPPAAPLAGFDDDDDELSALLGTPGAAPVVAAAQAAEPESTMMMQAWSDDDDDDGELTSGGPAGTESDATTMIAAFVDDEDGDDAGDDLAEGEVSTDSGPPTRQSRRSRKKSKKSTTTKA